ncbi:MAG: dihydrodipicolinate synthase family protein [Sedimentisphaeraceae bacterium JB056]
MRRMPQLKGLLVPPVTPMFDDNTLDLQGVINLSERYLASEAVDGLFAIGATGEYACLSKDERLDLISSLSKVKRNGKIIVVNTGGKSTEETLELSNSVKEHKLDAIAVVVPTHIEDTIEAMLEYYGLVNEIGLPFMVYRPPFITTHQLSEELVGSMMKFENFVGLKDSSRNMELFAALCAKFGDQISIFQGVEMLHLPSLACGSAGTVGGGLNIYPGLIADITNAFDAHDISKAIRIQSYVTGLWSKLNPDGSFRWRFKHLWKQLGVIEGTHCRIGDSINIDSDEMKMLEDMMAF